MIIGLYIGLAIVGLMALIRGKITLSKTKVVVGIPARFLGALALTPFPLALLVVTAYVVANAPNNPDGFARKNWLTIAIIEGACAVGVAVLVFVLGVALAISPQEAERRERAGRYDDDKYEGDDYEDDRRDRRSRDRDEDDRPRRRRNDDYEDDDRPRR